MAIQTTDGIILRKQNLRETSVILTLFTKDFGKISGVIKGARGPKAAIGHNPQVFSLNNVVYYEPKRGTLSSISQCDLKDFFDPIRKDLEKTIYADYFLELVDVVMIEGDADKKIYDLLHESLKFLSGPVSAKRAARMFEIKLMDIAGFMPEFKRCASCALEIDRDSSFSFLQGGLLCDKCIAKDRSALKVSRGTLNFIERVRNASFETLSRIKVSGDVGRDLERFLRKFVDYHVDKGLKTLEFLKKVKL